MEAKSKQPGADPEYVAAEDSEPIELMKCSRLTWEMLHEVPEFDEPVFDFARGGKAYDEPEEPNHG